MFPTENAHTKQQNPKFDSGLISLKLIQKYCEDKRGDADGLAPCPWTSHEALLHCLRQRHHWKQAGRWKRGKSFRFGEEMQSGRTKPSKKNRTPLSLEVYEEEMRIHPHGHTSWGPPADLRGHGFKSLEQLPLRRHAAGWLFFFPPRGGEYRNQEHEQH